MKAKPDLLDFKNVAIIQTAFLGDVIISLSLAAAVKALHPRANLIFITTPQAFPIVDSCREVDRAIPFDKRGSDSGIVGGTRFAGKLRELGVDCVISLHKSLRTTLLVRKIGAKFAVGFRLAAASFLYDERVDWKFHQHECRRNFEVFEAFKPAIEFNWKISKPSFRFPGEAIAKVDDIVLGRSAGKRLVVMAPGSVWETKRWGAEKFSELAKELGARNCTVAVIGSPSESELCAEVVKSSSNSAVNFAGKLSLVESLALISRSELVIANDSAPTHMANALGVPAITAFGATSHIFGFYPYREWDAILENYGLRCHPCRIHGGRRCPIGTMECMKSITALTALNESIKILNL